MSDSRPSTYAVAAIRERFARVSRELVAVEKQSRDLREAHTALSQTLRMFDPDAGSVAPRRPTGAFGRAADQSRADWCWTSPSL